VAIAAALTLAGCTGGESAPLDPISGEAGGTLTLLAVDPIDHLDPQRVVALPAVNVVTRLMTRTLTTYAAEPTPGGTRIVADLATDTGTPNADFTEWTWTLKEGVTWQDGDPVTCADVKYGVSRAFAADVVSGPDDAVEYLAVPRDAEGAPRYLGPYVTAGNDLTAFDRAVSCEGSAITFRLSRPVPDFDAVVARPAFAPVPKAVDQDPDTGGANYDAHVVATGPYRLAAYDPTGGLTLERNDAWDRDTDQVRRAYPDRVVVVSGLDPAAITTRLLADAPADQASIMANSSLGTEALSLAQDTESVTPRLVSAPTGQVRYLAINTAKVTDEKIRAAIVTAVNREAWRAVYGGEALGPFADGAVPASLPGGGGVAAFADIPPQGDAEAAKVLLAEAGATNVSLTLDYPASPQGDQAAEAIKAALAEARMSVTLRPVSGPYYPAVGVAADQGSLTLAGWTPDWASASAILPPLFAPAQIQPVGNRVLSQFAEPELQRLIDAAWAAPEGDARAEAWATVNAYVVERALLVPLVFDTTQQLVGSRVANAFAHPFYGQADLAVLAVRPAASKSP
jgi:peptide/nickel transport system substrate-binding protein